MIPRLPWLSPAPAVAAPAGLLVLVPVLSWRGRAPAWLSTRVLWLQ